MRRVFLTIALLLGILSFNLCNSAEAAELSKLLNGKKPYVLMVYTSWAEYEAVEKNMEKLARANKSVAFKTVNIDSEEAKALFARGSMTFAGFPYIQMARGKVYGNVSASCAADYACFSKKFKKFMR